MRKAVVGLLRRPLLTVSGVSVLAIGAGLAIPLLSYLDYALLRGAPFPEAERVILVAGDERGTPYALSPNQVERLRGAPSVFRDVGVFVRMGAQVPVDSPSRTPIEWCFIDAAGMRTLGRSAALGRVYTEDDNTQAEPRAVISYPLWQREYGRDPAVLGTYVSWDARLLYRIVGVMPLDFRFPVHGADIWVDTPPRFSERANLRWLLAFARLSPGVDHRSAQAAAEVLLAEGGGRARAAVELPLLRDVMSATARRAAPLLIIGAMAALLLSASVVCHLLWGEAASAATSIAVRLALGASRWKAVSVFVWQGVMISAAGVGLGVWLGRQITSLQQLNVLDRTATLAAWPSAPATLLVALVCLLVGIVAGGVPAVGLAGITVSRLLGSGQAQMTGRGGLARRMLDLSQVCFATVFVIGSIMTWASVRNLGQVAPGFGTDGLLSLYVGVPGLLELPAGDRRTRAFFEGYLDGVRKIPGVVSTAATSNQPIQGSKHESTFRGAPSRPECDRVQMRIVSNGYFATLGIPIVDGREFSASEETLGSIVVNRRAAEWCWPAGSVVGAVGAIGVDTLRVVGVVGDVRTFGVRQPMPPEVYSPLSTAAPPHMRVLVRVKGRDPYTLVPSLVSLAKSLDPDARISGVRTVEDLMADGEAALSVRARFLGIAGVSGFLIVVLGVYSTAALSATQRRRELAIRVALGGAPSMLVAWSAVGAVAWSLPGLLAGLGLAYVACVSMAEVLYGVQILEPVLYGVSAVAIALLVAAAAWLGGRRVCDADLLYVLRD